MTTLLNHPLLDGIRAEYTRARAVLTATERRYTEERDALRLRKILGRTSEQDARAQLADIARRREESVAPVRARFHRAQERLEKAEAAAETVRLRRKVVAQNG